MTWRSAKHFAREMLRGNRLRLQPDPLLVSGCDLWSEFVLFREGSFQVELITFRPGAEVPRHRHLRAESYDLWLGGPGSSFEIGGCEGPHESRGALVANLVAVPAGVWHGGAAGPQGAAYLSFQRWQGAPDFITTDWEAWSPRDSS